jgi:hypothetical protein
MKLDGNAALHQGNGTPLTPSQQTEFAAAQTKVQSNLQQVTKLLDGMGDRWYTTDAYVVPSAQQFCAAHSFSCSDLVVLPASPPAASQSSAGAGAASCTTNCISKPPTCSVCAGNDMCMDQLRQYHTARLNEHGFTGYVPDVVDARMSRTIAQCTLMKIQGGLKKFPFPPQTSIPGVNVSTALYTEFTGRYQAYFDYRAFSLQDQFDAATKSLTAMGDAWYAADDYVVPSYGDYCAQNVGDGACLSMAGLEPVLPPTDMVGAFPYLKVNNSCEQGWQVRQFKYIGDDYVVDSSQIPLGFKICKVTVGQPNSAANNASSIMNNNGRGPTFHCEAEGGPPYDRYTSWMDITWTIWISSKEVPDSISECGIKKTMKVSSTKGGTQTTLEATDN